ncbi:MAG: Endonuclease [Flavipsychrobacter sp.]|jgi:putative endonuclease|nr:Endonuclease [Flavipsychrobacter sp.]
MAFCTYILYSESRDRYYVGSCEDFSVRLIQHNSGRNKSTSGGAPWIVKKLEEYPTRSEALARESFIKKMKSRKFIEQVIVGER